MNGKAQRSGKWWSPGIFLLAGASAGLATQVDWSGVAFSTNVTSAGQPWDENWTAELGSFTPGFTPTAANTAQWALAWRAASRSAYQTSTRYFAGSYTYTENASSFTAGTQAYLWIFHQGAPQGEWLLLKSPSWIWPAGSVFDPFPSTWTTTDATQAIVGQLPAPSGNLTSAAVLDRTLPPLTFGEWRAMFFTPAEQGDSAISGESADPDKDGKSNLAEYLAGTQPRRTSSVPTQASVFLVEENGAFFLAAQLLRSTRVFSNSWQAQTADELSGWNSSVVTLKEFPWSWTVRRVTPVSASPTGFIRFRYSPP